MLIITRKIDEAIIIELPDSNQLDIIVTKVRWNQVQIGVDAA